MDWSAATWWWIASGVLVAAELTTGTFYLLMLALGAVSAALVAHGGAVFGTQLLVAAVVGGGAVVAWHLKRLRRGPPGPIAANRDVHLDVGERVQVAAWQPDGTTVVQYRGAQWQARFADAGTPSPGEHVIRAIDGARLMLGR